MHDIHSAAANQPVADDLMSFLKAIPDGCYRLRLLEGHGMSLVSTEDLLASSMLSHRGLGRKGLDQGIGGAPQWQEPEVPVVNYVGGHAYRIVAEHRGTTRPLA